MSEERRSNGVTERQMDRATERRATEHQSDGANMQQSNRKTKRISDGGTERQSDSNKTKILRLLNSYRKIDDSRDLEQEFSNAPSVGVLENYQ